MIVNQHTQIFCSVSSHPGSFGSALYNTAFQELGYDAIYRPLKCETISQFVDIVRYAKSYSISGISVSMPYKKIAVNLGTYGDNEVIETGNANTLVFENGKFAPTAYNTDCRGFEQANFDILKQATSAIIVGRGAVADSIQCVLFKHSIISICFSSREKLKHPLTSGGDDWLINASPVGMEHVEDKIFTNKFLEPFKYVSDVVCRDRETNLIKKAKKLGKTCVNGVSMSLEQLCDQFSLYTYLEPPRDVFERVLKENGYV
ncbi:MAG: hypothetical protein Q7K54_05130 [Candidatus Parcubacteria bacterium]|nr:hypothetical protein [Candidatus Parcubacteria bacterium]